MQLNTDYEYVDEETQQMIARYIVNQGDISISVLELLDWLALLEILWTKQTKLKIVMR